MGQLGTMLYLMLPVAVQEGRTGLLAIPLAGLVSCALAAWAQGRQSRWYTVIRKILAVGFGLFLWFRLSVLWSGYLGYPRFFPVAGLVLVLLLCLGRGLRWGCSGRYEVPGRAGLKALWAKVIALFLALLLLLQIPNLKPDYVFQFSSLDSQGLWRETAILFFLNIPFFLELGKGAEGGEKSLWKKQLGLWSLFFLIFAVLAGTFRFPLLVQSETVFLDLGRSAVWRNKIPVRMEIPADVVLWVTMFFALWECADTLWKPLPRKTKGHLSDQQEPETPAQGKEVL